MIEINHFALGIVIDTLCSHFLETLSFKLTYNMCDFRILLCHEISSEYVSFDMQQPRVISNEP